MCVALKALLGVKLGGGRLQCSVKEKGAQDQGTAAWFQQLCTHQAGMGVHGNNHGNPFARSASANLFYYWKYRDPISRCTAGCMSEIRSLARVL